MSIAIVQSKWGEFNSPPGDGQIDLSFDSNPTPGNMVIAVNKIFNNADGNFDPSLTDNQANSYTNIGAQADSVNGLYATMDYCYNIASSGTYTVTLKMQSSHTVLYNSFRIFEVSGFTSAPVVQFVGSAGTGTTANPGTLSTINPDGLFIALADGFNAITSGPGGSWTFTDNADNTGYATLITSATTQSPNFGLTSEKWNCAMATLEFRKASLGSMLQVF